MSQFSWSFIRSRVALLFLLVAVLLSLSTGREANAAEFYLAYDGCLNEVAFDIESDQTGLALDLCLANSDGYVYFFNYSWILEATDKIEVVSWTPDNGSPADTSDPEGWWISGTKAAPGQFSAGPVRVGTVTVDIGLGGGEIWAGSNGALVYEKTEDPGLVSSVIPPTLVPEPSIQILESVMLALLFLLGLSRHHSAIKTH